MMVSNLVRTDWKARLLHQDRLSVLTDIIKTSVVNVPFQNITSIGAVEINRRRGITLEDVLVNGLSGAGGMCGHINTFLHCLLKSLGYDSCLIAGTFRRTGIEGSHVHCKVNLPTSYQNTGKAIKASAITTTTNEEDWYIVDTGSSMAIHEPIQISKLPYLGRAGGLNFRYEKMKNGMIQRVHENGDALLGPKPSDYLCPQDYTINPTPVNQFSDFAEPITRVYKSRHLALHNTLFCFRYLSVMDSDFELIWLRGTEMITATKETRNVISFKDYYEMYPMILKFFPMIDKNDVNLAVESFQKELQVACTKYEAA